MLESDLILKDAHESSWAIIFHKLKCKKSHRSYSIFVYRLSVAGLNCERTDKTPGKNK